MGGCGGVGGGGGGGGVGGGGGGVGGGGGGGCFFFNDTATTEIYTLSLHDALPIFQGFPVSDLKVPMVPYSEMGGSNVFPFRN